MKRFFVLPLFLSFAAGGLFADLVPVGYKLPPGGPSGPPSGGADPVYSFTYSDPAGDVASGTLTATDIGGGQFLVTAGSMDVTASADGNASVGFYSLIPGGPAAFFSPSGFFQADNVLYPANTPALDVYGLLFGPSGGPGSGNQDEINIWGNTGANDYTFYSEAGGNSNIAQTGTFTLVATPEPQSIFLLSAAVILALAPFRLRARSRFRRS